MEQDPSQGKDYATLIARLRKRAEIRRSITRGEPDRISDVLEEAANAIESLSFAKSLKEWADAQEPDF